jgi:hypothetical protein
MDKNFASHVMNCQICKREGTIVNPNPEDYCNEGYKLLLEMIDDMQQMVKEFTDYVGDSDHEHDDRIL